MSVKKGWKWRVVTCNVFSVVAKPFCYFRQNKTRSTQWLWGSLQLQLSLFDFVSTSNLKHWDDLGAMIIIVIIIISFQTVCGERIVTDGSNHVNLHIVCSILQTSTQKLLHTFVSGWCKKNMEKLKFEQAIFELPAKLHCCSIQSGSTFLLVFWLVWFQFYLHIIYFNMVFPHLELS